VIIARYLTREVVNALLAVTAVLLLVFICQQLVRYLNYAAIGKIPIRFLLELVSFEIPYLLALLLPLGLFLGMILALGRLFADNEMAIMQMSGFDRTRLMRLSLFIAAGVAFFVLLLMLWINPWVSELRQRVMTNNNATLQLIQTLIPGRFQVSPDGNHVMYVDALSRDREKADRVFIAHARHNPAQPDQPAWMLVVAEEGYQSADNEATGQFFVTTNGYRYEGTPGQRDYKIIQFKKYAVRILQPVTQITHLEVEALSTPQLLNNYMQLNHAAELQWRISIGISAVLLAILAVQLCSWQPKRSRFFILLPAVIIYIIYVNLLFMARHWVEQGSIPLWIGMWWVHVLLLLLIGVNAYAQHR
jgi:lipopolysaccharide export system permease protein